MSSTEFIEITPSIVYVKLPAGGDKADTIIIELWDGRCYEVVLDREDARVLAEKLAKITDTKT